MCLKRGHEFVVKIFALNSCSLGSMVSSLWVDMAGSSNTCGGLPKALSPVSIKKLLEIGEVEPMGSVAKPKE